MSNRNWDEEMRFRRSNSREEELRREELKKPFYDRDRSLFSESNPDRMTPAEFADWADRR